MPPCAVLKHRKTPKNKNRSAPVWASFKSPQRFAVGSCYAPPQNHKCQFVGPPPYQCRAAFSPWAAAVGMQRNPVARQSPCCLQAIGMASLQPHIHHSPSASKQCCLTRRSTGPATACGVNLARSGFATVARQAYTACLRGPVSSNVRPHKNLLWCATRQNSLLVHPTIHSLPVLSRTGSSERQCIISDISASD